MPTDDPLLQRLDRLESKLDRLHRGDTLDGRRPPAGDLLSRLSCNPPMNGPSQAGRNRRPSSRQSNRQIRIRRHRRFGLRLHSRKRMAGSNWNRPNPRIGPLRSLGRKEPRQPSKRPSGKRNLRRRRPNPGLFPKGTANPPAHLRKGRKTIPWRPQRNRFWPGSNRTHPGGSRPTGEKNGLDRFTKLLNGNPTTRRTGTSEARPERPPGRPPRPWCGSGRSTSSWNPPNRRRGRPDRSAGGSTGTAGYF